MRGRASNLSYHMKSNFLLYYMNGLLRASPETNGFSDADEIEQKTLAGKLSQIIISYFFAAMPRE